MNEQMHSSGAIRTAIYIARAAYGAEVDLDNALKICMECIKKHDELRLTRIYRDEQTEVITIAADGKTGKRSPLEVKGNDAWRRLLADTVTLAVEAVVIYAARTVAPSISGLANMVREYFIPCGIRFIDAEAGFDTAYGNAEDYLKARTSEYRSSIKRKPYKKRKEAAKHGQEKSRSEIDRALPEAHRGSTVADSDLCKTFR